MFVRYRSHRLIIDRRMIHHKELLMPTRINQLKRCHQVRIPSSPIYGFNSVCASGLGENEPERGVVRSRRRAQSALLWGRFQPEKRASTSTLSQSSVSKVVPRSKLSEKPQLRPSTQLVALIRLWSLTSTSVAYFHCPHG